MSKMSKKNEWIFQYDDDQYIEYWRNRMTDELRPVIRIGPPLSDIPADHIGKIPLQGPPKDNLDQES